MPTRVDTLDELDDTALGCRAEGHDWPKGAAVEYAWTKTVRGKVVEAERRRTCRNCGTIARTVYRVAGGQFIHTGQRYTYPETPYLLRRAESGRPAATAAEALAAYLQRIHTGVRFA